jgi:hypothetical protein
MMASTDLLVALFSLPLNFLCVDIWGTDSTQCSYWYVTVHAMNMANGKYTVHSALLDANKPREM